MGAVAAQHSLEVEAKLDVRPGWECPDLSGVLPGVRATPGPVRILESVYWDTPDLRLVRSGITLRRRVETLGGEEDAWTLKLPAPTEAESSTLQRHELSWPGSPAHPPIDACRLVRAITRQLSLEPVAKLVTRRLPVLVTTSDQRPLAEVVFDQVAVEGPDGPTSGFSEVEVELAADGPIEVLHALVARLRQHGASPSSRRSKAAEALDAAGKPPFWPVSPPLDSSSEAGAVLRSALATDLAQLVRHELAIRLGGDEEDIHKARVATRRLRSTLKTFSPLLDQAWVDSVRSDLAWLADTLGDVRDADVLGGRLKEEAKRLPEDARGMVEIMQRAEERRASCLRALGNAVDSSRHDQLLERIQSGADQLPAGPKAQGRLARPAAEELSHWVGRSWDKLRRSVNALGDEPSAEALHAIRIGAKRLRYAAELMEPSVGKEAATTAARAARLQEVLGEVHDLGASELWLRQVAGTVSPAGAVAAGRLLERWDRQAAAGRAKWPKAWRRLDRRSGRRWTMN
jgi:CHAD domain-containing protein